ncbi:hypothetical protein HNR39_004380 [Glaciimonas immobilis]|uniref:Uncharacterized protein n=1 Tax=Glaciimonas immobilis TaxID=728004 RepID=A0A840RY74_9BURK|nr:hypothetical protein [Glaciimonas immobilis]
MPFWTIFKAFNSYGIGVPNVILTNDILRIVSKGVSLSPKNCLQLVGTFNRM